MKRLADLFRNGLILIIWAVITYLLWGIWWVWGAIWVIPGYILIVNVVGFATLPIYIVIGMNSPEAKWLREILSRDSEPPDSD